MAGSSLLLLSNSGMHGGGYLEYALELIRACLDGRTKLAFAPFALQDHDGYTASVQTALEPLGVSVTGLHTVSDPVATIHDSEALFVGGGNSFRLVRSLQDRGLLEPVRAAVGSGSLVYIGSSAGTNMACPTMRTTNDMPIVQPASFASFGLIPFQINPHYIDPDPTSSHMGETREQRIQQFHEENDVAVLGLREGAWLRRIGDSLTLGGETGARLFQRNQEPVEYQAGANLSFLLQLVPRFDVPKPPNP